jgi:Mn2+/Fe2+ NRAMP family transporter
MLAYVAAAFFVKVDWRQALASTLDPRLAWSREYLAILVGILGTTISPYLFFWQASQEVEEERAQGKTLAQRGGAAAPCRKRSLSAFHSGINWNGNARRSRARRILRLCGLGSCGMAWLVGAEASRGREIL